MKLLFATTNPAKIKYYGSKMKGLDIEVITPDELKIFYEVKEDGKTPIENAIKKAETFYTLTRIPTIALDEGLYFDTIPNELQPGTHVRRINGKRLNDAEMIEYYLHLVHTYGSCGQLTGYFLKGVAFYSKNGIDTFEYKMIRHFSNKKSPILDPGYPLASIQIIPKLKKFKSELTKEEEKITRDIESKELFDFILQTVQKFDSTFKTI